MLGPRPEGKPVDRFMLPRCEACGKFHFYPRPVCPNCASARIAWAQASGRGEVYSHSTVHRAPSPAFKDDVPYVIAIVKTDEGPHLLSRVVGIAPESVKIGMRIRVKMHVKGESALPVFEPESLK
jgi:uncharacterized OB-fold protein